MQPLPEKQCRICKEFKTRDSFYKSKVFTFKVMKEI